MTTEERKVMYILSKGLNHEQYKEIVCLIATNKPEIIYGALLSLGYINETIEDSIEEIYQRSGMVAAVKYVRETTGYSLAKAKEVVDKIVAELNKKDVI